MNTDAFLVALRGVAADRQGRLGFRGAPPKAVEEVLIAPGAPEGLPDGTVLVAPEIGDARGVPIGDAALAHPDGLLAAMLRALKPRRVQAVGPGRPKLRKLAVFVPESHLEAVRSAVAAAGAGRIGNYAECTFITHGEGAFRPLAGSSPFLGREGELERVAEARLEVVYSPCREAGILAAMRAAHPYEEIAYDVLELAVEDPEYGALWLGACDGEAVEGVAEKVGAAAGSNAIYACAGEAPRAARRVAVCAGPEAVAAATGLDLDALIADVVPDAAADRLHNRGTWLFEVRDLEACARRHLAELLRSALPVDVRLSPGGWRWQKYPTAGDRGRS